MNQPKTLGELVDDGSSDNELLTRYQQRDDADAFAAIYYRHTDDLRRHASRLLGKARAKEADDMMQEAFAYFIAHRQDYPPDTCVRRLLFKVIEGCCKHYLRNTGCKKRNDRLIRRLLPSDADRKADPARQEEKLDAETTANRLLAAVAPSQAEAIRLTKIMGYTAEEAAALTDTNARAYSERVTRGMTAMKKLATTTLILFALVGAVANDCDADVYLDLCAVETDEETNMTSVVNARNSEYDVLIARPAKWGNPFQIGRDGTRDQVIRMYEVHIRRRPDLLAALPELAGKRLGCYCKPEPCHGDVLVKLIGELFLEV